VAFGSPSQIEGVRLMTILGHDDDGETNVIKFNVPIPPMLRPRQSQQFDDDRVIVRPWSELDNEPDREVLIEGILFSQGVTTIVSAPGGGKTTFAVAIAMTVDSGGIWAGDPIKQRPVLWIVADDKGTLKSTRKIWLEENPGAKLMEGGGWIDGPVDLSDAYRRVKELRDWLRGKPPMLIVIDMLADCFGELDDEKAKDAIKVYKQIWSVVREHGSTFLNLQHSPWNGKRPKGSIAMPGKNDIILIINELNVKEGYIKMEHFKRREGPMLKDLAYETRLVPLEGKPHPLPLVTGKLKDKFDLVLNRDWSADEEGARELVRIVADWPAGIGKPTYNRLMERSGMEESAFYRARTEAVKVREWLVGGRGKGYRLNENECWKQALAAAPPSELPSELPLPSPLNRGVKVNEGKLPSLKVTEGKLKVEGKSSTELPPDDQADEALAVTLDTEALLKKINGKMAP
jgi:hypothetical protein